MFYSPKTSADGLVFNYDTGNTVRSYLGEPTTNTVGQLNSFSALDLYTWASSGNTSTWSRDTTAPLSPVKGIPLKEISSGTDSYSSTYNNTVNNISAASSGQTWTVSVYALAAAGTNIQVWIFGANSSGNYIELNVNAFTATGVWQRISVTMTFTNGSTAAVQARVATATNGGVIWWDGLQMEQKTKATQFTTGTRSATQGLKDLTAKNTINISTVSFDSNAQMTFDGTDDFGQTGAFVPGITSKSYEAVTRLYNVNQQAGGVIGMMGENGEPFDTIVYNETGAGWGFGSTGFARTAWSNVLETTTNFLHLVATYVDYSYKLYRNGQLILTTTSYPILNYNFNSVIIFGKRHAATTGPYNGEIPIAKVYNRALSADEVQRNFNAVKSRFNIA